MASRLQVQLVQSSADGMAWANAVPPALRRENVRTNKGMGFDEKTISGSDLSLVRWYVPYAFSWIGQFSLGRLLGFDMVWRF